MYIYGISTKITSVKKIYLCEINGAYLIPKVKNWFYILVFNICSRDIESILAQPALAI